jgi:nuclear cap-binding protein subunit 1
MADYDRRSGGGGGSYNPKKRRYRGECHLHPLLEVLSFAPGVQKRSKLFADSPRYTPICHPSESTGADNDRDPDDDDYDRRAPRRRFDAPPHVRVRKQLIAIAENPMRAWHDEVQDIANLFTDNWDDELLRSNFVDLVLQLAVEQPLKTPFLAAVVLVANGNKPEVVDMLLAKVARLVEENIKAGEWRDVKLHLKLLACLQGCLEGEGVFPVLEGLFERAVDLQTASSEDVGCPS